jgi:divalent metal cation (Fe/Co/Zn/Cd) transporter
MGLNACEVLYHQFFVDAVAAGSHSHGGIFGHSHSHNPTDLGPNINAAWLAAGSIVVKEYLYRKTMKIAKERKSSVLASNAVHHRIDSLTSIVALVAIGGSHLFTGTTWLDPVGGLLVSLMVIKAGCGNTVSALLELADIGVDQEIKTSVRNAANKAISQTALGKGSGGDLEPRIRNVQGVKAGQNYLMDIELVLPAPWTIEEARSVEDTIREVVGSTVRGVRRVRIRFVPQAGDIPEFSDEFIGADAYSQSSLEPEAGGKTSHDHEHNHLHHDSRIATKKQD